MTDTAANSSERIRVAVGAPGKTLFKRLTDRRIRVCRSPGLVDPTPDWVVFPCSQDLAFLEHAQDLPWASWFRSKGAQARVLLDASGEGRLHRAETTAELHRFAQSIGAPPGAVAYITQDRTYREDYLRHYRLEAAAAPLRIIPYDYFIRRLFADYGEGAETAFEERLAAYRARPAHRGRRFLSLNLTPRPTKVLFLLSLLRDGLWSQGHVSFGGFHRLKHTRRGDAPQQFEVQMRKLPGFAALSEELLPLMPGLDRLGEVLFGEVPRHAASGAILNDPIGDAALPEYADSWFTVTTESEMLDRPVRITEKPFKPLLNFHPLILLGNPGSLRALREMGFATFGGFFDEAYDEEPDPRLRFGLVYDQVKRLCAVDEGELARLDQAVSDRLIHNARWGMTGLPAIFRDRIDVGLVDRILAPAG
jgi:hypothetical protein